MLLGTSAGCKKETLTDEDLRSGLKSIISVASETKLFIIQIQEQRVTVTFAREHFTYLRDEDDETLHHLTEASGTNGNDAILRKARTQATELSQELGVLSQCVRNPAPDAEDRIDRILDKSQSLQASLR